MAKIHPILLLSLVVLGGCANTYGAIQDNRTSIRSNVFQELSEYASAPQGYADLRVNFVVKTHNADDGGPVDSHGTPDYPLLINIDGQAYEFRGAMQRERKEPAHLTDPEAGSGTRYRFNKLLRLKPGKHRLAVALPDDQIIVIKELELKEELNSLELEPVYGKKFGARRPNWERGESFTEGIRGIKIIFNGKLL